MVMVRDPDELSRISLNHPVADLIVVISNAGVVTVLFEASASCKHTRHSRTSSENSWIAMVRDFLDGACHDLSVIPIDYNGFTPFQQHVLAVTRTIPWGSTVSYRQLAEMAGRPSAVRAVASVMRRNPCPLIIPCHRVIRSDGLIGGYCGAITGKKVVLKQRLLDREAGRC
jgi:methylated-DNA-[protein]-cysteine S-methyltransferase